MMTLITDISLGPCFLNSCHNIKKYYYQSIGKIFSKFSLKSTPHFQENPFVYLTSSPDAIPKIT